MKSISSLARSFAANIAGHALRLFALFVTAARADWRGVGPEPVQRVYYANHTSNGDLPMIWAVLPAALRRQTRPVAAADYWLKNRLRAFCGRDVFRGVLIDRRPEVNDNPMDKILAALDEGSSLIIFPEGKRNMTDDPLLPFKSGLYNIAKARPDVDLVPTWVANLNTIMPKGEVIPLPLICTVTFGAPVHVAEDETREAFLARAAHALADLRPEDPA
ncbi:1-acyl-sn-glycerol-3-phosphate acyltransferase [Loktanella sp. TSTF-M6]|uniref:1-acyl-sn-glycerol-3-phosphate acyltransferase n=1 Tax=Loktanella gaetbuli TaxID=2881335 RepID=A0ABS8BVA3_9RHOB|nr:lysophospholipid acyltransferase family protein [Loktanella gaetbuli]MCB5199677.1 1-acyl-sn-glycerol-3-phosphate acyltransferase [Loktanella gaetbuli]